MGRGRSPPPSPRSSGKGGFGSGSTPRPTSAPFSERIQVDGVPAEAEALLETAGELREHFVRLAPHLLRGRDGPCADPLCPGGSGHRRSGGGVGGAAGRHQRGASPGERHHQCGHGSCRLPGTHPGAHRPGEGGDRQGGGPPSSPPNPTSVSGPSSGRPPPGWGAPFHPLDPGEELRDVELALDHTGFTLDTAPWGRLRLRTPLAGEHQAANAALAVKVLATLPPGTPSRGRGRGAGALGSPVAGAPPGGGGGRGAMDPGCGPQRGRGSGAGRPPRAGGSSLGPWWCWRGSWGTRTGGPCFPRSSGLADHAILTQPASAPLARRWDPQAAAAAVRDGGIHTPLEVVERFGAALELARERGAGGTVVVTGSCHTVGDTLLGAGPGPIHLPERLPPGCPPPRPRPDWGPMTKSRRAFARLPGFRDFPPGGVRPAFPPL